MTRPIYIPKFTRCVHGLNLEMLLADIPWTQPRQARAECFMARERTSYTYGSGPGELTYLSVPYDPLVEALGMVLNYGRQVAAMLRLPEDYLFGRTLDYNVCFLNRYDNEKNQLGWHADDTPGMLHEHPIAVASFGAAREIWWRPNGQTGVIPASQRQLLEDGSLFVMPAGFQRTHQHRIPKHDRPCGSRVSLTYRRYVP